MQGICFYLQLTPELLEACGYFSSKYSFSYEYQGDTHVLRQEGSSTIKIIDPLDIWEVESEGIHIEKTVRIASPKFLYGPDGVACRNAEIGICIIWTNKKLTQTGIIMPESDVICAQGRVCKFDYTFPPGMIAGDLDLEVNMYIKHPAIETYPDEENLINEAGASLGNAEETDINFDDLVVAFPIEEFASDTEPLWWVEFSEWEDPRGTDLFNQSNVCLYLNPNYACCPTPSITDNSIKNFDLLVDILAQTYFLMYTRLTEDEQTATKRGVGLAPNSICSVLHQLFEECNEMDGIQFEPPQMLLKSLQINLRKKLEASNHG